MNTPSRFRADPIPFDNEGEGFEAAVWMVLKRHAAVVQAERLRAVVGNEPEALESRFGGSTQNAAGCNVAEPFAAGAADGMDTPMIHFDCPSIDLERVLAAAAFARAAGTAAPREHCKRSPRPTSAATAIA